MFSETSLYYNVLRKNLLSVLNTFPSLIKINDTPIFVYAHLVCPHPPFVFGKNGEELNPSVVVWNAEEMLEKGVSRENYVTGYVDQVTFISNEIKKIVDGILSLSSRPSIIILQSDHGPASMLHWGNMEKSNLKERFAILNAYYFPDDAEKLLYESISPVNSFRVIMNHYFNTDYPILLDKSYFENSKDPYSLTDITDRLMSK